MVLLGLELSAKKPSATKLQSRMLELLRVLVLLESKPLAITTAAIVVVIVTVPPKPSATKLHSWMLELLRVLVAAVDAMQLPIPSATHPSATKPSATKPSAGSLANPMLLPCRIRMAQRCRALHAMRQPAMRQHQLHTVHAMRPMAMPLPVDVELHALHAVPRWLQSEGGLAKVVPAWCWPLC